MLGIFVTATGLLTFEKANAFNSLVFHICCVLQVCVNIHNYTQHITLQLCVTVQLAPK